MKAVMVPYDQLSKEALHNLIHEFVTRDGTDYGETEVPLETKMNQVLTKLQQKKAVIVFDPDTESATILPADSPAVKALEK